MLFSFNGRIRPLAYALASFAVYFSQYALVYLVLHVFGRPLTCVWAKSFPDQMDVCRWSFLLMPLRSMAELALVSAWVLFLALVYWLMMSFVLAVLAFRRAIDADIPEWIAACAIAPIVQIPVILILCVLPSRAVSAAAEDATQPARRAIDWGTAAQGMLAGMALTLAAVALGAPVFGVYGFGLFVVSPFVIGAVTAYLANRKGDIGLRDTALVIALAAMLGGMALIVAALEGAVCIIMAGPLGIAVALLGGLLGRAVALYSRRSASQTVVCVALIPLVFATEHAFPTATAFDTQETIVVGAPADVVWNSLVHMAPLDEPLALPFRLGVAYPIGSRFVGEGVGAVRLGEFSTGTALERVTEWVPNRTLAFAVVEDVPSLREMSPYAHVHAPHVIGYFTTSFTSFELVAQGEARTLIVERTAHELRLDPIFYWLPFTRWIVHENNARVLAHIRWQSERDFKRS
jgi:uncharacterized membrane protein YhaH (DUF805 family)